MTDLIGWSGTICFVLGIYLLGKKNSIGFYFNTLGNLFYLIQSIMLSNISLAALSIFLIILNIQAIWEWRKNV